MTVRVGINGFGRIGRNFFRAADRRRAPTSRSSAVERPHRQRHLAHLLKYDSHPRPLPGRGRGRPTTRSAVDGKSFKILRRARPGQLPWGDLGVDVVIESTGIFTNAAEARKHVDARRQEGHHLRAGHERGRHDRHGRQRRRLRPGQAHDHLQRVAAPRTASARWPRCCNDAFGIERGLMTTIHAYTQDQNLQDGPHKDLRRARAAALNIVPTSTGAAKAIGLVLPELKGKLDGYALRVPVPTGSATDLTVTLAPRGDASTRSRPPTRRPPTARSRASSPTPRTRSSAPTSSPTRRRASSTPG